MNLLLSNQAYLNMQRAWTASVRANNTDKLKLIFGFFIIL
jgi:hypothetical protein